MADSLTSALSETSDKIPSILGDANNVIIIILIILFFLLINNVIIYFIYEKLKLAINDYCEKRVSQKVLDRISKLPVDPVDTIDTLDTDD